MMKSTDFMKFTCFHEIHQISWWHMPDFMKLPDFMKSTGFHAWNPMDFMKSTRFHEIHRISCMKSARFHDEIWQIWWNLLDFMKSGRFHDAKWAKDQWSYFFICWITLHLLKFQSVTIRRKKNKETTYVLVNPSGVLYYVSDNFKKVWDVLTRQLRPWFFYLLDYIASAEISKCGD